MEYGKFNSAEELLKGYTELEKSFTQKCQRLSALEKQIADGISADNAPPYTDVAEDKEVATDNASAVPATKVADRSDVAAFVATPNKTPVELIRQYLDEHPNDAALLLKRDTVDVIPPRVMTNGGNVSMALPSRPKTIREASEMAKEYFK